MPRRSRRRSTRRSRQGGGMALLILLVGALLLLLLAQNGAFDNLNLPNIQIPVTGLPRIEIPKTGLKIPITVVPGTLMPDIRLGGTLMPGALPDIGVRSKTSGCALRGNLPDAACTPGDVMSTSTDQVCAPGYTSDVRDVSESQKDDIYAAYAITNRAPGQYQVDHLIPLSLGGSNDNANLWPQPAEPRPGYEEKDALERYLRTEVCDGRISIDEAQRRFATNWVEAYNAIK